MPEGFLKIGAEEWMTCNIRGTRLKAKDVPKHRPKVHPESH
jgi:hypothetical protein